MRIDLPAEYHDRPIEHVGKVYAPQILGAAGIYGTAPYQHRKLTLRELEAARYRTALINGCSACQAFRGARDFPGMFASFDGDLQALVWARGPQPDEEFYEHILDAAWDGYSEREQLAILLAEGMGLALQEIAHDEAFWERAKAVFSDEELVDMTYSIDAWMANGRALHVLGLDAVCVWVPPAREAAE